MSEQLNREFEAENDRSKAEKAVSIGTHEKELPESELEDKTGDRTAETSHEDLVKQKAKEKLETEMGKANDPVEKNHAHSIIPYLVKRCEEDIGMAEDVLQENKTWVKCYKYIVSKVFEWMEKNKVKKAGSVNLYFDDHVVYEWAEDYYHEEEKPESTKKSAAKADTAKEPKAKIDSPKTKRENLSVSEWAGNEIASRADRKQEKKQKAKRTVSKPDKPAVEGQMSLFDLL